MLDVPLFKDIKCLGANALLKNVRPVFGFAYSAFWDVSKFISSLDMSFNKLAFVRCYGVLIGLFNRYSRPQSRIS